MPDNKIELQVNAGQSRIIDQGIQYLIKNRQAEDATDEKYVSEVVPSSTGYTVRLYHIYVSSSQFVNVRKWHNIKIENENPEAKSVIYKISLLGFIRILSTKTISNYFKKIGVSYKDGDNIESIVKKVFPDAEVSQ